MAGAMTCEMAISACEIPITFPRSCSSAFPESSLPLMTVSVPSMTPRIAIIGMKMRSRAEVAAKKSRMSAEEAMS